VLAGFASVDAEVGDVAVAAITLSRRASEAWDEERRAWMRLPGGYELQLGSSSADCPHSLCIDAAV